MLISLHRCDRSVALLHAQAYAAARFAESCMRALDGDSDVYECAYIQSEVRALLASSMPLMLRFSGMLLRCVFI